MTSDLLETLQADAYAVLAATPALVDAVVLSDNEGDIESRVIRSLGPLNQGSTGKSGLVLVVMLPEVSDTEPNQPGPPLTATLEIQTIENVMVNRGASGTLLRSSQAAVLALNALHQYTVGSRVIYGAPNPIEPVKVKPGHVSHLVTLLSRVGGMAGPTKPGACNAAWLEGDLLKLACASGLAAIYYTTDGSYPAADNTGATLYTAPIAGLEVGTLVRAVGWLAGAMPGDMLELTVVADAPAGALLWNGWGPTWTNL